MKKTILFVCYGAGHVNMVLPLIKKYIKENIYQVEVLALTTAAQALKENGIPYVGFKDFVLETDKEALLKGEELAAEIPEGPVERDETIAYLGLSYMDLVWKHGKDKAEKLYNEKKRQAFCPTIILERVFDRYSPQLLVSTNSPRAERASFLVAKKKNIPSICIVGMFAVHEIDWLKEKGFGSIVCVLSEGVRQFFTENGREGCEISVTGNPTFDRLKRPGLEIEAAELRRLKNWKNKKVILWASQPEPAKHPFTGAIGDPSTPRRIEQELLKLVKNNTAWQLVIRYHPGENISPSDYPEGVEISDRNDDLAVLLSAVDVVITQSSTVGLEGLFLGTPMIALRTSIFSADAPFADMGLAWDAVTEKDLGRGIHDVLENGWTSPSQLPPLGESTDKISKHIDVLLKGAIND